MFLKTHPEFGEGEGTREVPDWAKGQRQSVWLSTGCHWLFDTKGAAGVSAVFEDDPIEGRRLVWGDYEH